MISVDVNERPVEADRALIERDQRSDVKCIRLRNAHRNRFTSFLIKRRARSAKKAVEIIAAGNSVFHLERGGCLPRRSLGGGGAIFRYFNKCDKEIQDAVAQLLYVSVLISRSFVSVNGDPLIDGFAVELFFFASRF